MRKVALTKGIVIASLAISLIPQSQAFAEPTPAPSATQDSTRTPQDQYRIDRDAYMNSMKQRNQAIRVINSDFKFACDKATADFKSAMSLARTPDQKNQAVNARKNAISAAILSRDTSIAALGAEPVPPVEPAKPMKISGKSKSR